MPVVLWEERAGALGFEGRVGIGRAFRCGVEGIR